MRRCAALGAIALAMMIGAPGISEAQEPSGFLAVGQDVSRLRFNLRRAGALLVGVLIVGSIAIPLSQIEMNFDTNETELFVTIGDQFSESLSLERKEEIVTQVHDDERPPRSRPF